ncbi:conserved exported hypothetical protein [Burkholderiales bacterium 8X]|nr:conserved exported hypothetical protein [Burkholderiales bacterium 8X]
MLIKLVLTATLAVFALSSCGGGGGAFGSPTLPVTAGPNSPSPDPTAPTPTPTPAPAPSAELVLRDSSDQQTTSVALGGVSARLTVRDAASQPVANKLVTFATNAAVAVMTPASGLVLTDANGVAVIQIAPAGLTVEGAGTLTATVAVGTATISKTLDYQVAPANLRLQALSVGEPTLAAYGNRSITATVTANGVPVTRPVPVVFSASCGAPNPLTATTNAAGVATTTYSATTPTCFNTNVTISAAAAGSAPVSGQLAIQAAKATNIQFVGSAPRTIYLSTSTGATQALVSFKVIDNLGAPLSNKTLQLALANPGSGVSLDRIGNTAAVSKTTDAAGIVAVAVFAGSIPTSVQVIASTTEPDVAPSASNVLTVASGRAVQAATSISLGAFAIEGGSIDGTTTSVTIALADRQGNPVPDGTQVNFTTEGGLVVPAFCTTAGGTSSCSVNIRSQGTRPSDGRVSILAYLPGEEDFVDSNGNNVYESGEQFTDLGDAYRDDNENNVYDTNEAPVPRASGACQSVIPTAQSPDNVLAGDHGRPNFCDGVWGISEIRRQAVVVFSTSSAHILNFATRLSDNLDKDGDTVIIMDRNFNSMPVGSSIAVRSDSTGCTAASSVDKVSKISFPKEASADGLNGYAGTIVPIKLTNCVADNLVAVRITTPSGAVTERTFILK